jgi:hypothetical protein
MDSGIEEFLRKSKVDVAKLAVCIDIWVQQIAPLVRTTLWVQFEVADLVPASFVDGAEIRGIQMESLQLIA